ncbi:SRPBCC domain-containing protein [Neogemmobacter tilapiae]|uniref:Vanillate O-demethylase oxidoreductase VanB n=1 Tax=Neogemmobacter tilapiae TaxID=875041 RepID=A0A918TUW6_9RHOB|nr:SRPBCC domain-containing protein [Gemmobacter tilapiae]GHC63858.1 vanillate O-demethylase oxidoreductase VanB [Gemmobacter tilapiae]
MTPDRITQQITIKASARRVWAALTDSQQFGHWFGARIDGAFAPGKTVQAEMTMEGVEGLAFGIRVSVMDAPQDFAFFWPAYDFAEKRDRSDLPWTKVEFHLEATPTGTTVTVTESGFDALGGTFGARVRAENNDGWAVQLQRLADFSGAQNA